MKTPAHLELWALPHRTPGKKGVIVGHSLHSVEFVSPRLHSNVSIGLSTTKDWYAIAQEQGLDTFTATGVAEVAQRSYSCLWITSHALSTSFSRIGTKHLTHLRSTLLISGYFDPADFLGVVAMLALPLPPLLPPLAPLCAFLPGENGEPCS